MSETNSLRPPVISVLGHVDHGKTSLLDAIRHTNVTASESGGITQHIGAYQVTHNDRLLTFIDTPGHAAFSAMRARGGQASDICILVVAADDGVMPQTRESINHIKNAGVPFVVALNKIDLEGVNPDRIKLELANEGVLVEGFGGNIPICPVSAKTGKGLSELLDVLILMADLENLTSDPDGTLEALVIESSLDRHKGPIATLIVQRGTLKLGDSLILKTGGKPSKVKALLDWQGNNITAATPSTPVQVLGFTDVPPVGSTITKEGYVVQTDVIERKESAETKLNVIIRADVAGTLEAIVNSMPEDVHIVLSDTGAITESDVLLAQTTDARIIGFRTKPMPSAKKLAQIEKIHIDFYSTIYDLLDNVKELVAAQIEKDKTPEPAAIAKVIQVFVGNDKIIAGCRVEKGIFKLHDKIKVMRGDELIAETFISQLKIGRNDVPKVTLGQECGLVTGAPIDFKVEDSLLSAL